MKRIIKLSVFLTLTSIFNNTYTGYSALQGGIYKSELEKIVNQINASSSVDLNEIEKGLDLAIILQNKVNGLSTRSKRWINAANAFRDVHIDVNRVKNPQALIQAYQLIDTLKTTVRSRKSADAENLKIAYNSFIDNGGLSSILNDTQREDMNAGLAAGSGTTGGTRAPQKTELEIVYDLICQTLEALGEQQNVIPAIAARGVSDNNPTDKIKNLIPDFLNNTLFGAKRPQLEAAAGVLSIDTKNMTDTQIKAAIRSTISNLTRITVPSNPAPQPTPQPTAPAEDDQYIVLDANLKDYEKIYNIYRIIETGSQLVFSRKPSNETFVQELNSLINAINDTLNKNVPDKELQSALKTLNLPDLHPGWTNDNLKNELRTQVNNLKNTIEERLKLQKIVETLQLSLKKTDNILQLRGNIFLNLKKATLEELKEIRRQLNITYEGNYSNQKQAKDDLITLIKSKLREDGPKINPKPQNPRGSSSILPKINAAGKAEFSMLVSALSILENDPQLKFEPENLPAMADYLRKIEKDINAALTQLEKETTNEKLLDRLENAAIVLGLSHFTKTSLDDLDVAGQATTLVLKRNSMIAAIKHQVSLLTMIGILKTALYAFTQESTPTTHDLLTKTTSFDNFVAQIARQADISYKEYNKKEGNNVITTNPEYIKLEEAATILEFKAYATVNTPANTLKDEIVKRIDAITKLFTAKAAVVTDSQPIQPDSTDTKTLTKALEAESKAEFIKLNNVLDILEGKDKKITEPETVKQLGETVVIFGTRISDALKNETDKAKLLTAAKAIDLELGTSLTTTEIKTYIQEQVDKCISVTMLRAVLLALGNAQQYTSKGLLTSQNTQHAMNLTLNNRLTNLYAAYDKKHGKGKAPVTSDANYQLLQNAALLLNMDALRNTSWFRRSHTPTALELKNYINAEVIKLMEEIAVPSIQPVRGITIALNNDDLEIFTVLKEALQELDSTATLLTPTDPATLATMLYGLPSKIDEAILKIGADNKSEENKKLADAAAILNNYNAYKTSTKIRTFITQQSLMLAHFGILKDVVLVLGDDKSDYYLLTNFLKNPKTQSTIIQDTIKNKVDAYKNAAKTSREYLRLKLAATILGYTATGHEEASAFIGYIQREVAGVVKEIEGAVANLPRQ